MTRMAAASDRPTLRFSLATASCVIALLCVLLAEYRMLGVGVVPTWLFTLAAGWLALSLARGWRRTAEILAALLGFTFVVLLLLPTLDHLPRSYYRELDCYSNLKHLGLAALSDLDGKGVFPAVETTTADGAPGLSWRVTLLPYLEHGPLHARFALAEPWDSAANQPLATEIPRDYRCPAEVNARREQTSYMAIRGQDTCWPPSGGIGTQNVRDGLSNTILIVETHDSGIVWTEPRDFTADGLDWRAGGEVGNSISSNHGRTVEYFDGSRRRVERGPIHAAMADGSVRKLSPNIDPRVLRELVDRHDGAPPRE
jgi:hypothetical protein